MREDLVISMLQQFKQDPRQFLSEEPPSEPAEAGDGTPALPFFTKADVQSGAALKQRLEYLKELTVQIGDTTVRLDQIEPGRAPMWNDTNPANLVDLTADQMIRRIDLLEERRLLRGQLEEPPWGSFYWPTYLGQLGFRYADANASAVTRGLDPKMEQERFWPASHAFYQGNPPAAIFASGEAAKIDLLSPAEKYDLLIGDQNYALTTACWKIGVERVQAGDFVRTWEGLCHGWAPASYMTRRPLRPVTVLAADGRTPLTFYPVDIKALLTMLWAASDKRVKALGYQGKAEAEDVEVDEIGRAKLQQDLDPNPATWHLAITNQIGIAGRSLIIDASASVEVWNQPVYKYKYKYFNPQTFHPTQVVGETVPPPSVLASLFETWQDARVERASFSNDLFSRHRSAEAKSIVGVAMEVTWTKDTDAPNRNDDQDHLRSTQYLYDLELDGNGQVIGGEWYHNAHPDVLWTPYPNSDPHSNADDEVQGEWASGETLPESWRRAAILAANHRYRGAPRPQVLSRIVNGLLALSRQ